MDETAEEETVSQGTLEKRPFYMRECVRYSTHANVQVNHASKEKSSRQTKFTQERIFEEIRTLPLPFYWRSITACKKRSFIQRRNLGNPSH